MLQQIILRACRYNRTTYCCCRGVRYYSGSSAVSTSTNNYSSNNIQTTHTEQQRRPIRISLPTFGQNGTLLLRTNNNTNEHSINNNINIAKVQIVPQWRDDALIELLPLSINGEIDDEEGEKKSAAANVAEQKRDDPTEIVTFDTTSCDSSPSASDITQTFGPLQITNHGEGTITSLGRKGSFIEVNILNNPSTRNNVVETNNNTSKEKKKKEPLKLMKIVATIPEKSNLTCQLLNSNDDGHGSDIHINGKLEGDVHLSTTIGGNITVTKLRGHHVTLDTTSSNNGGDNIKEEDDNKSGLMLTHSNNGNGGGGGVIHIQKAIEAKSVQINTHSRVRARMLNGSKVSINVVREEGEEESNNSAPSDTKLDDDDEGALIDVGSLYISSGGSIVGGEDDNEARLFVSDMKGSSNEESHQQVSAGLVRVKSCHGHVTVHAKTNYQHKVSNGNVSEDLVPTCPLVDIGGVNGSCDITLESSSDDDHTNNISISNNIVSNTTTTMGTRVHFDAMTPESISTITSRGRLGHTSITMDRKLESEVRMLSVAKSKELMPIQFDAHSLTSDDIDEVQSTLRDVNHALIQQQRQNFGADMSNTQSSIIIETDAYTSDMGVNALLNHADASGNDDDQHQLTLSKGIEYTQGTMSNRSGEPDSRFDVSQQQESSRGGKINIDGAASQALHGFRGTKNQQQNDDENVSDSSSSSSAAPLPLLAVASDGTIKLETLSWFGSIARRYGLEEEDGGRGVGRQASRLPRLDK